MGHLAHAVPAALGVYHPRRPQGSPLYSVGAGSSPPAPVGAEGDIERAGAAVVAAYVGIRVRNLDTLSRAGRFRGEISGGLLRSSSASDRLFFQPPPELRLSLVTYFLLSMVAGRLISSDQERSDGAAW